MTDWKKHFSLILLLSYLLVGFLSVFCHDHATDHTFHDDCPACQWQVLALDNTLSLKAIQAVMVEIAQSTRETTAEFIQTYASQDAETLYPTRAPPAA